ncbi:MAG: hypothetical protein EOO61_01690 [Hymenobacter sp.]|nr:MAG: hypothetical protein EOO61_01690 [Hymenobacter sp.]
MSKELSFFDDLKRNLDFLNNHPDRDNESTRHDLIIYPVITNKFGLAWDATDIISQSTINVPSLISESHIFRGAVPKIRKPDLIICPKEVIRNAVIIEEKKKQLDLTNLKEHRLQLSEYQSLYECNWGILTDGDKWLIKRGFETAFEFNSVNELHKNIKDFRDALGSKEVLSRYRQYNTFDLVFITPFAKLVADNFPNFSHIPTIVVGVHGTDISENGNGFENYESLKHALSDFPDLHPELNTERFTWAMKEIKNGKLVKIRFETWKAYEIYSR